MMTSVNTMKDSRNRTHAASLKIGTGWTEDTSRHLDQIAYEESRTLPLRAKDKDTRTTGSWLPTRRDPSLRFTLSYLIGRFFSCFLKRHHHVYLNWNRLCKSPRVRIQNPTTIAHKQAITTRLVHAATFPRDASSGMLPFTGCLFSRHTAKCRQSHIFLFKGAKAEHTSRRLKKKKRHLLTGFFGSMYCGLVNQTISGDTSTIFASPARVSS